MTVFGSRAWYASTIEDFLRGGSERVLGLLLRNSNREVETSQRDAWEVQYDLLAEALPGLGGSIFWEFNIPRMGKRVDVLLFHRASLIVIEFKVGLDHFSREARDQAWDYALDLKNFHATSHGLPVFPVVFATNADPVSLRAPIVGNDLVHHPLSVGRGQLGDAIMLIAGLCPGVDGLTCEECIRGSYLPTPTIVEAARALYSNHSVEDIARSDAGAKNLAITSSRLEEIATQARIEQRKVICFVTGVPGAGKTLVGLDVANRKRAEFDHAVFLSGNGPLVAVLREALTRDEFQQKKAQGLKVRKGHVADGVKAFIQNVHHFRDESLIDSKPPADRVVIFDEAQRAWDARQTSSFMHRKKNRPGFTQSEPELLLEYMDRHENWAVVICLVGGGQEINTGEAGVDAWLEAVDRGFPHWMVHISDRLADEEYGSTWVRTKAPERGGVSFDDSLHLSVSMRSFRAENLSTLVKTMLAFEPDQSRAEFHRLSNNYPLFATRNLERAKHWLRSVARGSERYGVVSSSRAMRLKPHALDVRVAVDPIHWFLNDRSDVRSSYYLEDVATEFQVQGLELDWTCVAWDGDLRASSRGWTFHDFIGDRWVNVHSKERQRYLLNSYRVLLTRARQGMVIFVPPGDPDDPTRLPAFYDPCWEYLRDVGIPELA